MPAGASLHGTAGGKDEGNELGEWMGERNLDPDWNWGWDFIAGPGRTIGIQPSSKGERRVPWGSS